MSEYCDIPKYSRNTELASRNMSSEALQKRGFSNARIYIKHPCPFCDRAIALLDEHKISFTVIDLTNDPAKRAEISQSQGNFPTVPMIFMNDTFVGGCDDLIVALKKGQL